MNSSYDNQVNISGGFPILEDEVRPPLDGKCKREKNPPGDSSERMNELKIIFLSSQR